MYRLLIGSIALILISCARDPSNSKIEEPSDNARLQALYKADQEARSGGDRDWDVVSREDKARRAEVLSILKETGFRTARDYYHAAMVFQHGESTDEIRIAYSLAWLGSVLDPDNNRDTTGSGVKHGGNSGRSDSNQSSSAKPLHQFSPGHGGKRGDPVSGPF